MARIDELRLITRVARLYYEQGLRQTEIAKRLNLSQSTVSRLLKRAEREHIVRITVSVPYGVYIELEEMLVAQFGLRDAIVVDCDRDDDDESIQRNIGRAAAYYLETTLEPGECIGISSWSATLLAMVNAMHQIPRAKGVRVVQILGGASESPAKTHAVYLASQLATLVQGEVAYLTAPAIVGSQEARDILLKDSYVRGTIELFDKVTLALVGIGAVEPSPLLASSGNIFSPEEQAMLRECGAVGDILIRFFDRHGRLVNTPLDDRVIGMSLDQLREVKRAVGVAGGKRKLAAIQGALEGGWINVLITDRFTAERLISEQKALSTP